MSIPCTQLEGNESIFDIIMPWKAEQEADKNKEEKKSEKKEVATNSKIKDFFKSTKPEVAT